MITILISIIAINLIFALFAIGREILEHFRLKKNKKKKNKKGNQIGKTSKVKIERIKENLSQKNQPKFEDSIIEDLNHAQEFNDEREDEIIIRGVKKHSRRNQASKKKRKRNRTDKMRSGNGKGFNPSRNREKRKDHNLKKGRERKRGTEKKSRRRANRVLSCRDSSQIILQARMIK